MGVFEMSQASVRDKAWVLKRQKLITLSWQSHINKKTASPITKNIKGQWYKTFAFVFILKVDDSFFILNIKIFGQRFSTIKCFI